MRTVWHLVKKEFKTQEKIIYALAPLPLIFFYSILQPLFNVGAYTIIIFLTAYFFLVANNHKQLNYKFDLIIQSLPINKHEILLAKYVMVIVWFVTSILICNVVGIIYTMLNHMELRISSLEELSVSLSILLFVSGIYYPLYYLLHRKILFINTFMLTIFVISGPTIVQIVPKFISQSPILLLLISIGTFVVSYWPTYLLVSRIKYF